MASKFVRQILSSFFISIFAIALYSCGGDEPEVPLPNQNEQTGNQGNQSGENGNNGDDNDDDNKQENDPNTYVGRYEGNALFASIPTVDRDLYITLQINSDKSGYYMESRQDGCKSYFYFDDLDFNNGYLWGLYGENQEQCLGKYESNDTRVLNLTLESTGFYLTGYLVRQSLDNDTKRYQDVSSSECNHNLEAGNLYGYWYYYGVTQWWLALKEDNTFIYKHNMSIRRGTYTVSGHTLRLYLDDNRTKTPYNIARIATCDMMLENGKNQYFFQRISETDFERWVGYR